LCQQLAGERFERSDVTRRRFQYEPDLFCRFGRLALRDQPAGNQQARRRSVGIRGSLADRSLELLDRLP
jgi:hypothetical protein